MLKDSDIRSLIKFQLLHELYHQPFNYWNRRFWLLSKTNALAHGRTTKFSYAVYFKDKQYRPLNLDWTNVEESKYCLLLHPSFPDLRDEMQIIAEELDELSEEHYVVERFLSGLVLFKAPPNKFRQTLGDTLYQACKETIEKHFCVYPEDNWDKNGDFSMNVFVEKNQKVVKLMNERIVKNIVNQNS